MIVLFLVLLGLHALADYPLQGPFLSAAKRRGSPEGAGGMWLHALAAHGAIHGFFVGIATHSVGLGLAEMGAHMLIDLAKCERKIGLHTDQALHVACKVLWVVLIVRGLA